MSDVRISNRLLTRLMRVAMQSGHADLAQEAIGTAVIDSPESDAAKLAKMRQLAERWKLEVGSGSISPHAEQVLAILEGDSHE